MPLTNYNHGVSSFGVPQLGGGVPVTFGRYIFVDYDNGSDGNNGLSMEEPVKTVSQANSLIRTNKHDVVLLSANSGHAVTAMITVSKNRCHWVGLDGVGARPYGSRTRITMGVTTTTAATDLGVMLNTGVGNSFRNLKFDSSNTKDESLYSFLDGGEYTYMENCEIYKSTDLDQTGAAELVANGDSSIYVNCYIGSTANAISGAIIRPCVTFSRELAATGKVARDVSFIGCIFARKCGNSANRFVYGAEANAIERMCRFVNCEFWNPAGTATPAQNVAFGSTLTDGKVLLKNCSAIGGATAMSTTTGVFVDGAVPAADTTGIALQAS